MSSNATFERVLNLLYGARFGFKSITATLQYRTNPKLMKEVGERWTSNSFRQALILQNLSPQAARYISNSTEFRWQVWWEKPWFWRKDVTALYSGSTTTHLINQEKNVILSPDERNVFVKRLDSYDMTTHSLTSQEKSDELTEANQAGLNEAFLDPSFLLSCHQLHLVEEMPYTGRIGYRVFALPRGNRDSVLDALFWSSADAYDILIDAQLGILLRYAAIVNDEVFAVTSVESFSVDDPIPEAARHLKVSEGTKTHELR